MNCRNLQLAVVFAIVYYANLPLATKNQISGPVTDQFLENQNFLKVIAAYRRARKEARASADPAIRYALRA